MAYVLIASRCALALLFLYSAITKLRGPGGFRAFRLSVQQMRLLPPGLVGPVAVTVVAAELLIPALLVSRFTVIAGLSGALALLIALTVAVILVVRRGSAAPCRCFGASNVPLGRSHVARNIGLIIVAALGLVAWASGTDQATRPAGVIVSLGVALILVFIAATLDDLVALFR